MLRMVLARAVVHFAPSDAANATVRSRGADAESSSIPARLRGLNAGLHVQASVTLAGELAELLDPIFTPGAADAAVPPVAIH